MSSFKSVGAIEDAPSPRVPERELKVHFQLNKTPDGTNVCSPMPGDRGRERWQDLQSHMTQRT
jgi:hypothetical protein